MGPLLSRSEIADYVNRAFTSSDVGVICSAIGEAARLYNISDIAQKSGLSRPSIYRAFGGQQHPNLSTVLSLLDAMGFQLKITQHRGQHAPLVKRCRQ